MESIFNAIVAMGIKEGTVLFQVTAKAIVQALCKGNTCNGNAYKGKE
jgi:hypothetical protein